MGQAITESACRQWGARGFRKMLRIKGLGGRRRTSKRNQGKEPQRGTKKRNQEEEPKKEKPPRQYRGETDTGGWKDSSLTVRMTVLVVRQNSK